MLPHEAEGHRPKVSATYVREEHARNAAPGMEALLAVFGVYPTLSAALVKGDRVLVRLDATVGPAAKGPQLRIAIVRVGIRRRLLLPAEREIRRRDDLDKIHVVHVGISRHLPSPVQRIEMVVRPGQGLVTQPLIDLIGQLRPKAQVVDDMRKRMRAVGGGLPVILQVMHVHIPVTETSAGGEVKVANHPVNSYAALDTAALTPLLIQSLSVALTKALFHVLTPPELPRRLRIRLPNLVAGVAATGFLRVTWRRRPEARPAIAWVEVGRNLLGRVSLKSEQSVKCSQTTWYFGIEAKERKVKGGQHGLGRKGGKAYRSSALTSITPPPSLSGLRRTLCTPCMTPCCCSPDTSITSRVRSSQGSRGNVMFKCISILSPGII